MHAISQQHQTCLCRACGCQKLTGLQLSPTPDSFFFESVNASDVHEAAREALKRVRQQGGSEVMNVRRSRSRWTWHGGRISNPDTSTFRYTLNELEQLLEGITNISLVRAGTGVAILKGLMIGSYGSKIACSLVLGYAESRWQENDVVRHSAGFPIEYPWEMR